MAILTPSSLRTLIMAAILSASATWAPVSWVSATELVRVTAQTLAEVEALEQLAPESHDCGATHHDESVEFAISPEGREKLEAEGLSVEVLIPDLEAHAREGIQGGGPFGLYHTYTEAITAMDQLVFLYPELISPKASIGQTVEGREIYVYKISDNPNVDEDEPEIFFNAYIHAREAITFEILHGLAEHLLSEYNTDPEIAELVNNREVYFLPVVNPDGVEYNAVTDPGGGGLWRKNRSVNGGGARGVDLNRNFGHLWGYDNSGSSGTPSSETYRGPSPFSEPETAAMRDFVLSRNFSLAVNYHAYSRLELFAPEFDADNIEDYDELLALGELRAETSGYDVGPTWHVLYPINGGANDWMYSDDGKPRLLSILTEVGTSFWPPESQIASLVAENLPGNLRLIEMADNPSRALAPAMAEVLDPGPVGRSFYLHWVDPNTDSNNPPQTWNVIEGIGHSVGPDDFEGDVDLNWESRGWTRRANRAASGQFSMLSGNGSGRNDLLESKKGFRVSAGDELSFSAWYNLQNGYDYTYVEVATEAGNFEAIAGSITTSNNPQGQNTGHGITGSSGGWVTATFDLADYVGETIWFRFHSVTDRSTSAEGFYIDDVSPMHLFSEETVIAAGLSDPEFLVTAQSDGPTSFMVQAVDGEGQGAPYSVPLDIVVANTSGVGDPAESGPLDPAHWQGIRVLGRHPFREQATLALSIPSGVPIGTVIDFRILDVQGRLVSGPVRGRVGSGLEAGNEESVGLAGNTSAISGSEIALTWRRGETASGAYFAKLRIGDYSSERRIVLMR